MRIVELKEPLRSYFRKLEGVHIFASELGDTWTVKVGSCNWFDLPPLDREDAEKLAEKIQTAVRPIIDKFMEDKLEDVTALIEGTADEGLIKRVGKALLLR